MSPSAVLQRRPARSPVQELPRPTPSDAPTAMRLVLTHRAEGPARPRRVPRHATSLAPDRQQRRDSSILHSFHIPPQANRCSHLLEHVQRLQDHPVLESIALESLDLSFPPSISFQYPRALYSHARGVVRGAFGVPESSNLSFPRMRESILGSTCGFPPARERRRGRERRKRQSHPAACHSRACESLNLSFPRM